MSTSPSSKCVACTVPHIHLSYSQRKCICSDNDNNNNIDNAVKMICSENDNNNNTRSNQLNQSKLSSQQVPKFPKLDLPERIDNESKRYDKKEDNKLTKSMNDNIIIKDLKNNKSTSVKMLSKSKSTLHLFYLFLISIGIGISINLILKYITIKYLLSFIL